MATKARKAWSATQDQQLLVAIVNTLPSGALDYEKIAQYLGQDLTANAVNHRIRKIKAMFPASGGQATQSPRKQTGPESRNESPKKRKLSQPEQ